MGSVFYLLDELFQLDAGRNVEPGERESDVAKCFGIVNHTDTRSEGSLHNIHSYTQDPLPKQRHDLIRNQRRLAPCFLSRATVFVCKNVFVRNIIG